MSGKISLAAVIPAHNSEATLERAVLSVFAQTRPVDEIIVIDDASTDSTAALARGYSSRGVRVLSLPECRGAAAARNVGIRAAAKGAWIAFLDADDEWLPAKLQMQVGALSSTSGVELVFCASEEFSPDGHSLGDTFRGWPVSTGSEAWKDLLACNFIATSTVVARRELLLQLGGFDETLKVSEDQDMWIRLALAGRLAYVSETLSRLHVRTESLSSWKLIDQYTYTLPMIEKHLAALNTRLTRSEARAILGARLHKTGLTACAHGHLRHGLRMILRSALLGYKPLRSLMIMCKAASYSCVRKCLVS